MWRVVKKSSYEIMFCTICSYILFFILLFLDPINGRSPLNSNIGYANFQRNLPRQSLRQNEQLLLPANSVVSGENVQKLLPIEESSIEANHNGGFGVPSKPPAKKPPKKISDRNAAPENVHRVQEMTALLWPMGVVPYFIDKNSYDTTTRKRIIKAMAAIEAVSCVIFRELVRRPEFEAGAWLHFTNPRQERECRHRFDVLSGGSEVVLGFDCLRPEEILHSLLHSIGFRDEVTHPQRDQYIRVMWDNIQPKYRDLFRVQYEDAAYKLVEYDPMSIMHFHDRAFSDNGAATIVSMIPGLQISSNTALSQLDIMRLKLAFNHECNKRNVGDLLDTCKNSLSQKLSHDQGTDPSSEKEVQVKENVIDGDLKSEEKHSNGDEKPEAADTSGEDHNRDRDYDKSDGKEENNETHNESKVKSEENNGSGKAVGVGGLQKLSQKRQRGSHFVSMYDLKNKG